MMAMKILFVVLVALVTVVMVGGGLHLILANDDLTNVCGILLIVLFPCILFTLPPIIEKHF